jgi:hygromycin-B 4-O-kinase
VSAAQWLALVPAVVAALEAMRTADLSASAGFGGWGADGHAAHPDWRSHLLAVVEDRPDQRGYGWRAALATSAEGQATFDWGLDLLQQAADDMASRSLLHCDLTNRNVFVKGERITGVFDWGCSLYGDHLYDLAWFEFWAPWHPELNVAYLRSELERRWREVGYAPADIEARLMARYLHIGLAHLAYNAYRGDWSTLAATADRLRMLMEGKIASCPPDFQDRTEKE